MKKKITVKLTYAAVCLALAIILPGLIGRIPEIGRALSPMHLPVLLAGFLCGPAVGAVVGLLAPLLNSAITGMPPLFPVAAAMAFELAAYGLLTGIFYHKVFKKKNITAVLASLVIAMLLGRAVWGIAMLILMGLSGAGVFTWSAFFAGAFAGAVPALLSQIILIPAIVMALKKSGIME